MKCRDCRNYANEWCDPRCDSPDPDLERDCEMFSNRGDVTMKRYAEAAIEIINDLHTERLDYDTEYLPLIDAAIQLKNLEEIIGDCNFHRLRELLAADREKRCVVLPENIKGGLVWITRN